MLLDPSTFCTTELTDRPQRELAEIITVRVAKVEKVAPDLLEITVTAPALREHRLIGPDEFFGLLIPSPGREYAPVPRPTSGNLRSHLAQLSDAERPELRWYTVRHLDRRVGALAFQVVTHGVTDPADPAIGPALRWALGASPGDICGISPTNGLWCRHYAAGSGSQLLIADPTAAPSVVAVLEFLQSFHPDELRSTGVILAAPSLDSFEPGIGGKWASRLGVFHMVTAPQEELLVAVLDRLRTLNPAGYVWCCGERAFAAGVRRFSVSEWGMDPRDVTFSGFWIEGQARG